MTFKDGEQCASFDGDADRLIFFFTEEGKFRLLDGDRIAILCAIYMKEKLTEAGLDLNLGIVQVRPLAWVFVLVCARALSVFVSVSLSRAHARTHTHTDRHKTQRQIKPATETETDRTRNKKQR